MDVYNTIKGYVLLEYPYIEDELTADEILHAIKDVERYILNYTRLQIVPSELYYTWSEMVIALARDIILKRDGEADTSSVTSIKAGDTSISFNSTGSGSKANLDDTFYNFKSILKTFRRLIY